MRVLIDCTQIPLKRTGVGVYADELLSHLPNILASGDALYVLIQEDDALLKEQLSNTPAISVLTISSHLFRNRVALAVYEQLILPLILLLRKIDVVHSLHYTHPIICPCARVVTLHDMTFFVIPEMHTRARRLIMSFFIKKALRSAEVVIFVSDSTKADAQRLFGVINDRQFVTPLGVDLSRFERIPDDTITNTLTKLGIEQPYILSVGTIEPRKNLVRVVHAFEQLKQYNRHYKLIIAGRLGWDYEQTLQAIEQSSLTSRIHRLGYVTTDDKTALIAGCSLLLYPSLYEGFGLPVLEGMAAGVPVITSTTSSLREVAGNAALLVDPHSTEQIVASMKSVLSDSHYADGLRKAGKKRAEEFSWEKTALLTYRAYQKADEYQRTGFRE
jgi:glycosyltransferase involved in cell wall biosynthesis